MVFWLCFLSNTLHVHVFMLVDNFLQTVCMHLTNKHFVKHIVCIPSTHEIEETICGIFIMKWRSEYNNSKSLMAARAAAT
jgi:hypothetical protein